jgi:hypothetical protein
VLVVVVLLLGVVVVVVLWVALLWLALFMSLELDGVVLVLCASASVPVRSRPAA